MVMVVNGMVGARHCSFKVLDPLGLGQVFQKRLQHFQNYPGISFW